MAEKAVVDRFEEGFAVLLVGDTQRLVNVPRKSLPKKAKEGSWLQVEFKGDQAVSIVLDRAETARAKQRIMEKLERLRRGEQLE